MNAIFGGFTWQDGFLLIFLLGLIVLFLRDFKPHDPRAWLMLLALLGMGGFVFFEKWRRNLLKKEFLERENVLKEQEEQLKSLKDSVKISEAAYNAAMESLAREKSESKKAILALEAQLARKVEDRAVEYQNMSDRDVMMKFEELTGMK